MAVRLKTYNEFLGGMIRKIIADTPLNDINTGSVLLTLLEAIAANDFENNTAILNVLELLNLDALRNNDLDAKAADFGLSREAAIKASGFVTIKDSNITKRSTGLYPVKPPPIAGSTVINVNNAADWAPTGNLYIGRGTTSFEGPIPYTAIIDNGTFFSIQLGSALQKDHLISDTVVDGQGTTDRLVAAGTIVKIPANNQSPEIEYVTLRDAVLPAGEDTVSNTEVQARIAGSSGNAGINTITLFGSLPFAGATVTNTTAFTNGSDIETDDELRLRIKSYASTLARGTKNAILAAIVGISDADDNKQVASAVITEPVKIGDPSIIYLDDGSGFQPSYTGQSVDKLLNDASGDEEFLQLANFPLPRPQVVNTAEGPYQLVDGMELRVSVDDNEEIITFNASDFSNISAATLPEIVTIINDQATIFKARMTEVSTRLLLYPTAFDAEIISVQSLRAGDNVALYANGILKFPTNQFSHIKLYQNNLLLKEKEKSATLLTTTFNTWNITVDSNLIVSVDGTPAQDRTFSSTDFGGTPFSSLTLEDWVEVFNSKFAGLKAESLSSGRMRIVSNKSGNESGIKILGGSLLPKWFSDLPLESAGQTSDFQLNRQNGNIRILRDILPDDDIAAGAEDTKGAIVSLPTTTGNFNVSTDANSRPAEIVIVADANTVKPRPLSVPVGITITISDEGSNVMRILSSSASSFRGVFPTTGDYFYIANRGDTDGTGSGPWVDLKSCGLFKVIAKGEHTTPGVDTYIEVLSAEIVPGTYTVLASEDLQAFFSDAYPQLWKGSFVNNPPTEPIQGVVDSFNNNLVNVKASIFKTNSIKLTSTTEEGGSIAIPVSIGNATLLFATQQGQQTGNPSHIANRRADKDASAWFRRTEPTNLNVWLGRYTYTDVKGPLTANAIPGTEGVDSFSEILTAAGVLIDSQLSHDNIISFTKGNNKGHYRNIRQILSGDRVGTQHERPRTLLDHIQNNDEIQVLESLQFNGDDSIVVILDKDSVTKTIDVPLSRRGKINSGSQSLTFLPTNLAFSANDADNEPGVDFGTPQVWSKTLNGTEFKDYKIWFRARNWYVTGGVGSGLGGRMLVRALQYGPVGEKIRFALDYPTLPDRTAEIVYQNNPFYTAVTYLFGSGPGRTTNIIGGTTIDVADLGGDQFRLTFSVGVDLTTVQIGDVFSALNDSGISVSNRGQYRIKAVNAVARTIDIYNPNGSPTAVGQPEIVDVECIGDIVGTAAVHDITTVGDIAGSLDGTYFILWDGAGDVAFWYDETGSTPEPSHGAARSVRITSVLAGDNAATVAAQTAIFISADPEFNATVLGNVITVTNEGNGNFPAGSAGTSGFTVVQTVPGVDNDSLDGKYFILQDAAGSVAFWFDVNNDGTPEPIHGADRSVPITSVLSGDNANTVAGKVHAVVNGDPSFTATVLLDTVTVTDISNAGRPAPSAGTSGFTLTVTQNGSDGIPETVLIATSVNIFPLTGTAVSDIVSTVNENQEMVRLVAVGSPALTITRATREEEYTPAGPDDYSASLSYGHDPDPTSGNNLYVNLYDAESFALQFSNNNPNFTLKKELLLVGVAPSVYQMDTAPNDDSSETGEFFKLIPTTLNNIEHHMTQKALSQLPIVSDVEIAKRVRGVQLKSKLLGSVGAIEVVGGRANLAEFDLINDSETITEMGKEFLQLKIKAFPDAINIGDIVKLQNLAGVDRLSRLKSADTVDVVQVTSDTYEYRFNPKDIFFSQFVNIAISDVSASYGRPAGTVWRWTHNDSGSLFNVTDLTAGVPGALPDDEIAAGGTDAVNLETVLISNGGVTNQQFQLTVSGLPTQADYFTFRSASGATFAVWFDIDAAGIAPTGASYVAATNKIEIDILSTDTPNQIVSKLATVLGANGAFIAQFSSFQTQGATLDDVAAGDIVYAFGTLTGWDAGNKVSGTGDDTVSGYPIVAVNSASRYFDVVNPWGATMSATAIGSGSTVQITAAPVIKWNLGHSARADIAQIVVSGGVATATTTEPHKLRVGSTFNILNSSVAPSVPGSGIGTVVTVPSFNQFTFATGTADGTYSGGTIQDDTKQTTRYRVELLGFNNLVRLKYVDGAAPRFLDHGVAVDDLMVIGGSTFRSNNNGVFRIRAVDNTSILYENVNAKEEVNTDVIPFNNTNTSVNWTASFDQISGAAGSFENLAIGDSVKKLEDDETFYRQVVGFNTGFANTATIVFLNGVYEGTTSTSIGVKFDQLNDVEKGVPLQNIDDITILEGDSTRAGDSLFVSAVADPNWFNANNTGTFEIQKLGTSTDYKPQIRVKNTVGMAETNRLMSIDPDGVKVIEGEDNKFDSIRMVEHLSIDEFNDQRRVVYLTTPDRAYKFSESNNTVLTAMGKLGYSTDVVTGVDGYLYYTGLLRTVQRTIDGFEADPEAFPGRRAVGGLIELLPPLIRRVTISIDVTTNEGVNLGEISNEIKSVVINYVNGLGVGNDVILSEIIARVMQIRGIQAVTFNIPVPSTERIPIADIEKAFIEARDISIA